MNRAIREATIRYLYDSHDHLRTPLAGAMAARNFVQRLKTLNPHAPGSVFIQGITKRAELWFKIENGGDLE